VQTGLCFGRSMHRGISLFYHLFISHSPYVQICKHSFLCSFLLDHQPNCSKCSSTLGPFTRIHSATAFLVTNSILSGPQAAKAIRSLFSDFSTISRTIVAIAGLAVVISSWASSLEADNLFSMSRSEDSLKVERLMASSLLGRAVFSISPAMEDDEECEMGMWLELVEWMLIFTRGEA
jgi:hypothetical protein